MKLNSDCACAVVLLALAAWPATGQALSLERLDLHGVKADSVTYRGRAATRIADTLPAGYDALSGLAVVGGASFQDGTIEVAVSSDTAPNAPPFMRGFVGIAFRVAIQPTQYELLYIRTKNGRSDDQLQRNHSTQYVSVPGFPWEKLRAEAPGKYEVSGGETMLAQLG